ncbi:hypothetical protein ACGVWS_10680 [Enterobacteriaceae bacterium LUAb1]
MYSGIGGSALDISPSEDNKSRDTLKEIRHEWYAKGVMGSLTKYYAALSGRVTA